jgi:hypothetical protein
MRISATGSSRTRRSPAGSTAESRELVSRGPAGAAMVRGAELDVVYVQLLALGVIALVLVGFSAWKFRGQMS